MNRIGIVFLGYWLGISTSVIQTAKALAQEGFPVDIFIDAGFFSGAPIDFREPNIQVVVTRLDNPLPQEAAKARLMSLLPGELASLWRSFLYRVQRICKPDYGVEDFIRAYGTSWKPYLEVLTTRAAQEKYLALIGVEPLGLLAACYAIDRGEAQATHVIYYNLELLQHNRSTPLRQRLAKDCEIICSRRCDFTVIPDENRGQVFARANGIEPDKLRYLPVSTAGKPVLTKSRYFRDLFDIPDDKTLVLYAGNIQAWAMCREIVESVAGWQNDFVLVMHTWRNDLVRDPYYQEILKIADPDRVHFSTRPVPYEELPAVLSSADVGLAFYRPLDANFTETGSSSNKLAQYAQVGLPVIANNLPSIHRVFEAYGSGVCVERPAQIGDALRVIRGDYARFRQGALNSYQNHYNFSAAFEPILTELKQMANELTH